MICQAGETLSWKLIIKNLDGSRRDISAVQTYAVFLFDENQNIIHKYSNVTIEGFTNTLTDIDANEGEISMINEANITARWKGQVYWKFVEIVNAGGYFNNQFISKSELLKLVTIQNNGDSKFLF